LILLEILNMKIKRLSNTRKTTSSTQQYKYCVTCTQPFKLENDMNTVGYLYKLNKYTIFMQNE